MPIFVSSKRCEVAQYLASRTRGVAQWTDEKGGVMDVIKDDRDTSAVSYAVEALLAQEMRGIPITGQDLEALRGLAKGIGYKHPMRAIKNIMDRLRPEVKYKLKIGK